MSALLEENNKDLFSFDLTCQLTRCSLHELRWEHRFKNTCKSFSAVGTRRMRLIMLLTLMIHFSGSKDMTNRTRIEIISQILEIANGGVTCKTRIMYKANLSYSQLKEYLRTLSDKDLLSYDLDTRTFKTTERGLRFLKTYSHLNDIIRA